MYNVKWDPEINGILLSDDGEIVPPRPVFYENIQKPKIYPESTSLLLKELK